MPNRILRDWTDSDKVNQLSTEAEVFFVRLIMKADDFGVFYADPNRIKSACYPLKDSIRSTDITRWLEQCQAAGLVRCFEATGSRYTCITNFGQRLRQMRRKFPKPPDEPVSDLSASRCPPADHTSIPFVSVSDSDSQRGKGDTRGKGGEPAEGFGLFEQMRREIGAHFKRPETQRWGYEDERLLAEICTSPTVIDEWHTILSYRSKETEYRRQSLPALLQNWAGELDKARNYQPPVERDRNGNPKKTYDLLMPKLPKLPQGDGMEGM